MSPILLKILFALWYIFPFVITAQQKFTGDNRCIISIKSNLTQRDFRSDNMSARLNVAQERFEFFIPLSSIVSLKDTSDIQLLDALLGTEPLITIFAELPLDKDEELDLSFFKINQRINLPSTIIIGPKQFKNETFFTSMLTDEDQSIIFNFTLFINMFSPSSPIRVCMEIPLKIASQIKFGVEFFVLW